MLPNPSPRLALIAAAAALAGCAFIAPNALDIPEALFDLSEPFSYTRLDAPLADADSLVETARWDQAVPISLVMTEFSFGPGELRVRSGVPYALKIGNQGVWPHAFGAKHFFRAIAVRSIEPAPFDGPSAIDGGAISFVPDAYGPSATYIPVAATAAQRGARAPIRGAEPEGEMAAATGEAGGELATTQIPEAPFSAIKLDPNQAVIVYFVPVLEGTYYLRSVRTDDLLRGMRGRIIIE